MPSSRHADRVVIVGGSAAGLSTAQTLRREGFERSITVVSDELGPPYDRPPLSKELLAGQWGPERISLATLTDLAEPGLEWLLGRRAVGASLASREVGLDDGTTLSYDALVVATGLRARRPSALVPSEVRGIHTLRTLQDAVLLREELAPGRSVVIVGAGFIGAEVAATAVSLGAEVTLVDALQHPLGAVAAGPLATYLTRIHREHGVRLRCNSTVSEVVVDQCAVAGVVLNDGSQVRADVLVIALGSEPNTEWLDGNGLDLVDGVRCDRTLRAAPGIFAVGDVSRSFRECAGREVRIEHRLNATEQGMHVGLAIAHGSMGEFTALPYFWSDQFGQRLQGYGRPSSADEVLIVDGSPDEGRFVLAHGREGRLVAVTGIGMPRKLREARAWLNDSRPWQDLVADCSTHQEREKQDA